MDNSHRSKGEGTSGKSEIRISKFETISNIQSREILAQTSLEHEESFGFDCFGFRASDFEFSLGLLKRRRLGEDDNSCR
jgi:hypothetical protein